MGFLCMEYCMLSVVQVLVHFFMISASNAVHA